jgi:hypothetical protein
MPGDGQPVGWIEGYAGTPRKQLSGHQLRASLIAIHAPLTLASPLPTVAALVAQSQLSSENYVIAGTVEVSGVRVVNFHLKNIDTNGFTLLARPFRVIDSEKFLDDAEDPYIVATNRGVRIPVVCDCEVVGLEVKDFEDGSHARYTVGVGFTP